MPTKNPFPPEGRGGVNPFASEGFTTFYKTLKTPEERQAVIEAVGRFGVSQKANDVLWILAVCAMALVMVGVAAALAVGYLSPPPVADPPSPNPVKPELLLSLFTSVVGFVSGLFIPSPVGQKKQSKGTNQT